MAAHFSANQYEQAFAAQRLQNWEVPKKFKERPSTLEGFTQPISNDRGHILPGIPRSRNSPWGEFIGTWDLSKATSKQLKAKTNKETSPEKVPNIPVSKDNIPKPASPLVNEPPTSPMTGNAPEVNTRVISPVGNEQQNSSPRGRAATPENIRTSPATGSPREKANTSPAADNNKTTEKFTSVC